MNNNINLEYIYGSSNLLTQFDISNLPNLIDVREDRNPTLTCIKIANGQEISTYRGEIDGYITDDIVGDNGFGYDPIFYYPQKKCTFAQMSMKGKNLVSHRSKALSKICL